MTAEDMLHSTLFYSAGILTKPDLGTPKTKFKDRCFFKDFSRPWKWIRKQKISGLLRTCWSVWEPCECWCVGDLTGALHILSVPAVFITFPYLLQLQNGLTFRYRLP